MKIRFLLPVLFLLFLTGCSNILIADNTVMTIDNDQSVAKIDFINNEQPGKVCSVTNQKTLLSINKQNDSYSIDMYDPKNSTLVNITTSENRIFDIQAAKNGFFYTRNSLTDPNLTQINWSSYDKTNEKTITFAEDNVEDTIYAYDGDKVIFINNGNELIFSDSSGNRKSYNLSFPVNLRKIIWPSDSQIGFMIAAEQDEDNYNLYQVTLNETDQASTNRIAKNVLDMSLSPNNQLVYVTQGNKNTIVYEINDLKTVKSVPLFKDVNIEKITYNFNGSAVIYSVQQNSGTRSTLYQYDMETGNKTQLSSPARIISSLFTTEDNQIVYSISQQTYLEINNLIQTNNYITNLKYSIE